MNIADQMLESLYAATVQTGQGITTLIPAIENLAKGNPKEKDILSVAAKYKKVEQLMLEIQKDLKHII
jgi:hypothetical protein